MELFALFKKESKDVSREIAATLLVSALANVSILVIINAGSRVASYGALDLRLFLMFVVAMTLYILCLKLSYAAVNGVIKNVVHKIRIRVARKVQESELEVLERIGKSAIYDAISRESILVEDVGDFATVALQAGMFIVFAFLYMLYLSPPAFLMTVCLSAIAVLIVQHNRAVIGSLVDKITEREIAFLNGVTDAIEGFKETKLNERRGKDLADDLREISSALSEVRGKTADLFNRNFIFTRYSFYVLIGALIFVLPAFFAGYAGSVHQLTTAILFIIGPLTAIVASVPDIFRADKAANTISRLEQALDEGLESTPGPALPAATDFSGFRNISLEDVRYKYKNTPGEESFSLGPISSSIDRGEIVFIVGGNGSGKSTFLEVLAGLYPPDHGRVLVDGAPIDASNIRAYRELFAAIFSDFHLFDKLYGLEGVDERRVNDLLQTMQLQNKTVFVGDRFTNLNLSTGQRKRLALITCLLEDRPIYLLDELAADQDPRFRQFLYEELLPQLKREGKTIIAITHDDRYFQIADKLIRMEYGRVQFAGMLQ